MWRKRIHFELQEMLGEGSQGRVFKALRHDPTSGLKQIVAVKILHSRTAVELWRHEFESLHRVRSPYCVQVLSFERIEQRPALVLEFVDGVSLARLGNCAFLSAEDICEIVAQLEQALKDLHSHGVFHGDLSPQNVLIDHSGRVRLLDFGLANSNDTRSRLTPRFAAPERLSGAGATLAADIYSLGQLESYLIGRHPVNSPHLHSQPEQRRFKELKPSGSTQKQLSKKISVLLEKQRHAQSCATQTHARERQKAWSTTGFLVGAITCLFLMVSSSISQSIPPRPLGVLQIHTLRWHHISIDGRPVGYTPLSLPLETGRPYNLSWISARGRGEKVVRLMTQERRIFQDSDFSH